MMLGAGRCGWAGDGIWEWRDILGGYGPGGGAALCFIFMRVFCCCFLLLSLLLVDVVDALTLMHSRGYERMAFAIYTSWLCCFVKGV